MSIYESPSTAKSRARYIDLITDVADARNGSRALLDALAGYHLKRAKTEEARNHWRSLTTAKHRGLRGADKQRRKVRKPSQKALDILERALAWEGVEASEFNAKHNGRRFIFMRQAVALAAIQEDPRLGYAGVSRLLGREDRTTIVYAILRAKERCEYDQHFARIVEALRG